MAPVSQPGLFYLTFDPKCCKLIRMSKQAKNEARASYFNTTTDNDTRVAFDAGWDARNDALNRMLMGDLPAAEPIEMALKAYSLGYQEGSNDNDQILERFEDFARRAYGLLEDGPLKIEAGYLLAALEASVEEPTNALNPDGQ